MGAFSLLKGSYVVDESAGKAQQKFGDEFPEWPEQMKTGPLGRAAIAALLTVGI
jgi:hypothetical protein